MSNRRSFYVRAVAALLFCAALGAPKASRADFVPEYEVGGMLGGHLFNPAAGLGRLEASQDNYLQHAVAFGLRVGIGFTRHFMLEAELLLAPTHTIDGSTNVLAFGYRAHGIFHILTGRVRPFLALGAGGLSSSPTSTEIFARDTVWEAHAGGGLKVDLTPNFGLRLDARVLIVPGAPGCCPAVLPEGEFLLGAYARLGEVKRDPPPPDGDHDGIPDALDECPSQPGKRKWKGCPPPDADGDGVPDSRDKCPNQAGLREREGCPPPADADKDGIPDDKDKCPNEAGPSDRDGCPLPVDSDKDGIPDDKDKCPNAPETMNGYQDDDGCPDELPKAMQEFTGTIAGVTFRRASAQVDPRSYPVLDRAAKVLLANATIKLEIAGHSDNIGDPARIRQRSQERADAVRDYLIKKGVDGARLKSVGYGADRPIASNKTIAGQAQNRRVEFTIIK